MATSNEFFIVHSKDRIVLVQEFRVEDDLYSVRFAVEELDASNLIQDRVVRVVRHVMRNDRREGVSSERQYTSFDEDLVFVREERAEVRNFGTLFTAITSSALEQSLSDSVLDLGDCILELLSDGLSFEGFDGI